MISRSTIGSAYPVLPLGSLVEFLDHKRKPVTESDRKPGPYPYYGANGQQGTIDDYIFDEDLVLLAEDGGHFDQPERGIAYRITGKSWVNNHAHVLRPNDHLDINYLSRVLENYDVTPFVTGTTRGKLTKASASEIPIPVPAINEQRRIAEILDKADELRAKRVASKNRVDWIPRTAFVGFFGDPLRNDRGWPIMRFEEVGTLDRGVSKHRPRNAAVLLNGPYPFVQTGDIANCDGYIRGYGSTYSEAGLSQSRIWPRGTLCITIAANIAKTGILGFDACFPDSVVGFIPSNLVTTEYVQTWLSFLQATLERIAPESAQKNINLNILRNLPVPVPPVNLQREFTRVIHSVEELRSTSRDSLHKLELLFGSLQSQAFRGEL